MRSRPSIIPLKEMQVVNFRRVVGMNYMAIKVQNKSG